MQQWLIYDNDGASGWQAENDSGLSSAGRDGVAAGFVRYALDHGEKEGTALWLDRIQDPDLKKSLSK